MERNEMETSSISFLSMENITLIITENRVQEQAHGSS
jgi:hypothetical protein